MTNVLLIRPKPHKDTIGLKHVMICEPLELEYLVSNLEPELKDQYHLILIDMLLDNTKLSKHLKQYQPSVVIFTGYNTHVNLIKAYSKEIKMFDSTIVTAVGGVHVEVVPDDFKDVHIDVLLWRNGIDAFNMLLRGLRANTSIQGIQNEIDQQMLNTEFAYNPPDRQINAAYRAQYYYMFHNPCALIKTSFGCPFKCAFCFCHEITGGQYYERTLEDVISELKEIREREIYIVDDNFLVSEARVRKFIEILRQEKIDKHYLIYGRADFIAQNAELMADFKAVGLHGVIVGIESVREKDLKSYDKLTTVKINEEAVAILNALDVECYSTLIMPLDFSKKDFNDLKHWLKKTGVNFVNLQPLTPLKGTAIYDDYVKDFIEAPSDVELWDMAHIVLTPKYMSKRQFYFRIWKLYYEVVMSPKHLIRLVKKYGIRPNLKMLVGSSRVSMQYILKMIRG
ncbi:B12-binding domain-containing radical SAM protein [Fusibacter ferrireducens]|uniref:Radical SAM protein n=1 Tax=Fusibacter ferrireducens TaxID=2785058 RepID=A0ABR9ZW64_9FIRM|nr:radical SAM protein [Fusibacter ferrireducens]MBF4694685.1 radical SAM protein [Fusibacter ferrireducens]